MWEYVELNCRGDQKVKLIDVTSKLQNLKWNKGGLEQLLSYFNQVYADYTLVKGEMTENEITNYLLNALPREYNSAKTAVRLRAIESWNDQLKLEETIQYLRLFDSEERRTKQKYLSGKETRESGGGSNFKRKEAPAEEKPMGFLNTPPPGTVATKENLSKYPCHNCGKTGHWKYNCPEPLRQRFRAPQRNNRRPRQNFNSSPPESQSNSDKLYNAYMAGFESAGRQNFNAAELALFGVEVTWNQQTGTFDWPKNGKLLNRIR